MIRRFLKSRGWRKYRRNRLAMASSAIIGVYFVIALLLLPPFNILTLTDAQERVLPRHTKWRLESPDHEDRFNAMNWFVRHHLNDVFDRAGGLAGAEHPEQLRATAALAERTLADVPDEELQQRWESLAEVYAELDDLWLEREGPFYDVMDLEAALRDMRRDGEDPAEIAATESELQEARQVFADYDRTLEDALQGTEAALADLMPMPEGWAGVKYAFRTFLGSDESGRSTSVRAFYSIKVAFQVGFVAAIIAVFIGTLLGAAAGFYGGWVDHIVMWLVSTLSSVPYIVLLAVLAYIFRGSIFDTEERPALALVPLYVAFSLTFWISTCRVIRGEVMKIKELEYVQAATAIGFSRFYIMLKHVIPNTAHIMFINFSLVFIGAIKSEVILSFLGLGVKGQPSWGIMISLSRDDVQQFIFWTVLSPTILMFGLVLAFNVVSDALQDAFDPKHVS